tara:strand:+ start:630 stop:1031 length:402 start_codon:yes stop_codon:yes gene_type:complete
MENTFKQIVLIQIILLPVLVLLEIFFPVPEEISYLPYFSGAIANMSDGALIFSAIIGIGLLITNWVSCFLIYFFKPLGRPMFLWTLILLIASYLITPHVSTGLFGMLDSIDSLLAGATLVFMYITPIKEKFSK